MAWRSSGDSGRTPVNLISRARDGGRPSKRSASVKPRRPGTRAGRAGLVYRGPRTSRCGPPRRRLRRLCPPWRSGRRPGRRPTRRRSRHKVTAACPLEISKPRTSAAGARPAASRRRSAKSRRSARRGASCRGPIRPRGGRAARRAAARRRRGRSRPAAARRRRRDDADPERPLTWVVSRTFPISTLDASPSPISRPPSPAGRRPEHNHCVRLVHGPRRFTHAKAAEPASRARCQLPGAPSRRGAGPA